MDDNQGWGNTQFRPTWGRPTAPPNTPAVPNANIPQNTNGPSNPSIPQNPAALHGTGMPVNPAIQSNQTISPNLGAGAFRPFKTRPPRSARLAALKEEADTRLSQYGSAGFQVVRSAFFATNYDPHITIRRYSVSFNSACINSLETATHVKIMVDGDTHRMMIKPCAPGSKGAVRWCNAKRKKREISCRELTDRLYALMQWPDDYRFRLQGVETVCMGERVYYFNLDDRQAFAPTYIDPGSGKTVRPRGEFPEEWKNSFGLSEEETDAPVKFFVDEVSEQNENISSFRSEGGAQNG